MVLLYIVITINGYAFRACEAEKGICTFPSAHVELTKRQQLLMIGQPYKIRLELEMPESPANKGLGKFLLNLFIILISSITLL